MNLDIRELNINSKEYQRGKFWSIKNLSRILFAYYIYKRSLDYLQWSNANQ